jgi:hypothetical protein
MIAAWLEQLRSEIGLGHEDQNGRPWPDFSQKPLRTEIPGTFIKAT